MKINTVQGTLEAMAWHIGRHVAMSTAQAAWRLDGEEVDHFLMAILDNKTYRKESPARSFFSTGVDVIIHDGNRLTFATGEEVILSEQGCNELIAVLEHAMLSLKGLDEMHEDDERKRYGLSGE